MEKLMNMVPVVWASQHDGRPEYACTAQLNYVFDQYPCVHFPIDEVKKAKEMCESAIFVVHGDKQTPEVAVLNAEMDIFESVLVIVIGDEENLFPVERIDHTHMKLWIQEPMPGRHDAFVDRRLIMGFTPYTAKPYRSAMPRDYDFFFAGQVTHSRRYAAIRGMEATDAQGVIIQTRGYQKGISLGEYLSMMGRSKFVPCPSGPFSCDSARPWEALQCGAVPILDDLSPSRRQPGFWNYVLGEHPLPVITDWDYFPEMLEVLKRDYPAKQDQAMRWWQAYQEDYVVWLGDDWRDLREGIR